MRVLTDIKRDSILQAATEIFHEQGFEGASMAGIASRIGGSKSTLYRYFSSKEELFVAVSQQTAKSQIIPSLEGLLTSKSKDLSNVLQEFGETAFAIVANETSIKAMRTVVSEAGRSDIGRLFFQAGPQIASELLARFFQTQMVAGNMRAADPKIAARHLIALLESETVFPCLMGIRAELSNIELKGAVQRAIETFLGGYGVAEVKQQALTPK
ncbi:TetR/AcrR family transcriptional regulator [Ewingella sp. S1.OA.A_B6]